MCIRDSRYMTSVIFDGNDLDMGNVIKVKINRSNQNTLFGKSLDILEQKVAWFWVILLKKILIHH